VEQRPDRHVVTWSCDGPFPARRNAAAKARAIHCIQPRRDWAKRLAAQPTDRQTTRINQRETERPGVPAPGVIWLCAVDSSRSRSLAAGGTAKKWSFRSEA